jgi:hypothetical protein
MCFLAMSFFFIETFLSLPRIRLIKYEIDAENVSNGQDSNYTFDPRSQVQLVVYTDSIKNTHWFKSTLARLQKVGTFQILSKVWGQWPVIGLKSTLACSQRVQILGSVTSMTLIGESVAYHCSAPVACSVSRKFNFVLIVEVLYNKLIFLWHRFWSRCITNTNAPRISEIPASFLVIQNLRID